MMVNSKVRAWLLLFVVWPSHSVSFYDTTVAVYMVDGRWRMPSALACFLHASARGAPHKETTILIHDCQPDTSTGRVVYKSNDHLLKMVDHSGDKLCVYKRRPETTDQQLMEAWHKVADIFER